MPRLWPFSAEGRRIGPISVDGIWLPVDMNQAHGLAAASSHGDPTFPRMDSTSVILRTSRVRRGNWVRPMWLFLNCRGSRRFMRLLPAAPGRADFASRKMAPVRIQRIRRCRSRMACVPFRWFNLLTSGDTVGLKRRIPLPATQKTHGINIVMPVCGNLSPMASVCCAWKVWDGQAGNSVWNKRWMASVFVTRWKLKATSKSWMTFNGQIGIEKGGCWSQPDPANSRFDC